MLKSLRNALSWFLGLPVISWIYGWMVWWTLLPIRVLQLGWQHKKVAIVIVILMIMSVFLHDHNNTPNFHGIGPIRFVLVGLMNFFYGILDSVMHFGADVVSIPFQKMDGCPPDKFLVGFLIGCVVHLYFWAIPESLVYWIANHVISPELLWGIIVGGVVYKQILPGGRGGSSHAPTPKAAPAHG
ncbi:MAG: hypothetical protein AAB473_04545 [Patescibacteria group bacterium]